LKEAIALYYKDESEEITLPMNEQVYITTIEMAI